MAIANWVDNDNEE